MGDPLDDLVTKGRSKREDAHAEASREQERQAREMDRKARNRLYASASDFTLAMWLLPVAVGLALWPALRLLPDMDTEAAGVLAAVCGVVVLGVCYAVRPLVGRRALVRKAAALRALPFQVSGYTGALSNDRTQGTAQLVVRFAGETKTTAHEGSRFRDGDAAIKPGTPDDKTLGDAFFAIGATLSDRKRKDGARVIEWSFDPDETSYATNAHLDRWIWRAVHVLMLVHTRYPIASVEIEGFL